MVLVTVSDMAESPPEQARGILYWRRADGPPDEEDFPGFPTPRDAGPAWVIEVDGTERFINGGDWITRAEAERLAAAGQYTFDADG